MLRFLTLLALAGAAQAQTVTLNGSMAERAALLIIDGQPRTVAVGASHQGVKVVSVGAGEAVIEVAGRRATLTIGSAPVSIGSGAGALRGGNEIVLTAGPGGHFITSGAINGKPIQFMVDTGASAVSLGQSDADRMGINYRGGQRVMMQTANGHVPAHIVTLSSVRVGDVEVANVQAVIMPASMEHALLGNSFLTRFQMRRDNDVMRLEKRP